ncbi:tetratricopeptide repeat protein [Actinomadura citrea]|uniref:tetratricopeptide repeat protein n=1 Tax=Actinomadura citrea TaxID=46158 RepID=UPI003CE48BBB
MERIAPERITTRRQFVEQMGLLYDRGGWSHHRLAHKAGLSSATVRKAVSDTAVLPRADTVRALMEAFHEDPAPWLEARGRIRDKEKGPERAAVSPPAREAAEEPPPPDAPRHLVGVIPRGADCYQIRDVLALLEKATAEADGAVPPRGRVLTGMGGVGKTQLAAAYAREVWDAGRVRMLLWVTASSRPGIVAGYAEAAAALGLSVATDDPEQAARRFLQWASTTGDTWLIVLDDIREPGDVQGWWPPDRPSGQVLATTWRREAALVEQGRRRVNVGLFTPEEARDYLTAKFRVHEMTDDPGQMDALAEDLGWLPLALAQAAAYMVDLGLDCAGYRERLADRRRTLAELVPEPEHLPDDHGKVVAAAWSLSIERADQARPVGLARPLLQLCSVLNPNGIPSSVLTSPPALGYLTSAASAGAAGRETDGTDVWDGLRVLHRFSLLDHDTAAGGAVRVHALIQRATRETLGEQERLRTAHTAADALMHVWPRIKYDQITSVLRTNANSLHEVTHTDLWRHTGDGGRECGHPVLFRAARSLSDTGQVEAAVGAYDELFQAGDRILGPEHPDTMSARRGRAHARGEAGDIAGAMAEYGELLSDLTRTLGPEHPRTFSARNDLATLRRRGGDVAGAIEELEELLAEQEWILGADHPDVLATRRNLANSRGEAGDADGAVNAFESILAHQGRLARPDDPDDLQAMLSIRESLAKWRGDAGDAAGAAAACEELLADRERIQGPDHPQTLAAWKDALHWRWRRGDTENLLEDYERLVAAHVRILGADNPATLVVSGILARVRGKKIDPASAVEDLERLVADHLRVLGPDHPETLRTRAQLAYSRGQAGDAVSAVSAYEDLLADHERILGRDHPQTLATRNGLGRWQAESGDVVAAVTTFEEVLADRWRVLGRNHEHTQNTLKSLERWRRRLQRESQVQQRDTKRRRTRHRSKGPRGGPEWSGPPGHE